MNARTELHEMIRRRIKMLPDSPEKEAFEKDVSILFSLDNNQSLQGITAGAWLDKLQESVLSNKRSLEGIVLIKNK